MNSTKRQDLREASDNRFFRIGAAAVFSLTALYVFFMIATRFTVNSDNMYFILAAEDMLDGNWTLAGWRGGFFSALTGDILWALPLRLVLGRKAALYLIGPISCGLVAAFAFLTLRSERQTAIKPGWVCFAALLPVALIPRALWHSMATVGMHAVAIAQIFALVWLASRLTDRPSEPSALSWVGFAVCVALGCVADGFVLYFFAAPCLVVAAVDAVSLRRRRALKLGAAALGGVLISKAFLIWLERSGGLTLTATKNGVIGVADLGRYLMNGADTWLRLFTRKPWLAVPELTPVEWIGAGAMALFTAGMAARCGVRLIRDWRGGATADKLLFFGGGAVVASFTLTDVTQGEAAFRYLAPAYFLWIGLAVRAIPRLSPGWRRNAALTALVLIGWSNLSTEFRASPLSDDRLVELADALKDRGAARIYGTYWESAALNYYSGNRIQAAPIVYENGTIGPSVASRADWYRAGFNARCLLVDETQRDGLTKARIEAFFGPADEFLLYNQAEIRCYDVNLSEIMERNGIDEF